MNRADMLERAAIAALQGFCANPSIFAPSFECGWRLVNGTDEQLAYRCWEMARALLDMGGAQVLSTPVADSVVGGEK